MTTTDEAAEATAFKPPVYVQSRVERRPSGEYWAGACFDRGSWFWRKLAARRADKANEQGPEAVAQLMVYHAKLLEEQAQELLKKAAFLRDCARFQGVI